MRDDLGGEVQLAAPAARVVSLVPSLTEAIAETRPSALVGATDWCTHPADLDVARVRGTKNPDLAAIRALEPDVVIANQEENRELDVRRLRDSGVQVWVTNIRTVEASIESMRRLFAFLQWPQPSWLDEVDRLWSTPVPAFDLRVAVAIWRDPWMVVGGDNFTSDLVTRLGATHVHAGNSARYPHVDVAELDDGRADLLLLPDEPYVFTADDGPEAFTRTATALCSGRALTWYGPSMLTARDELRAVLAAQS